MWTLKTKFLLTSLYRREELPLFGYLFPAVQAGKRGEGRFSEQFVFQFGAALTMFYCLTLAFFFLLKSKNCALDDLRPFNHLLCRKVCAPYPVYLSPVLFSVFF